MDAKRIIAGFFLPDDESWLRHANPWSIWTRFITLPFIVLAVWSRVWIGWYCLVPLAVLIVWVIINPRLFAKPASYDNWGSKAVLGERIYVNDTGGCKQSRHKIAILVLTILQTVGGLILLYGVWKLDFQITLHGMSFIYLSKMWFLDRMVWLYEDMQESPG